jgi:hypothetical protein
VLKDGFNSITIFFDKHYARITAHGNNATEEQRAIEDPKKSCPTIFLINKQIFREAHDMLAECTIVFTHGLLSVPKLSKIIHPTILSNISTIEINDDGHPIVKKLCLGTSWSGHLRLIKKIANVLITSKGTHQVKTLKIVFNDPDLVQHMTHCFESDLNCGYRDQMKTALNRLYKVRVDNVVFVGLNPALSRSLKAVIESKPRNFNDLPQELRDIIYGHCLDWSDVSSAITRSGVYNPVQSVHPAPALTTPKVLLLSKTTTAEALEYLRGKPLNIKLADQDFPDPFYIPALARFITPTTLKHVSVMNVTSESSEWIETFTPLVLNNLSNLKVFKLEMFDRQKDIALLWSGGRYPDARAHRSLRPLTILRGLEEVQFSGDIPEVYGKALAKVMMAGRGVVDTPGVGLWRFPTVGQDGEESGFLV